MINKILIDNNYDMIRMIFPISNGVVVLSENKKVVSTIGSDGKKDLKSGYEKNKVIFWNFPFVRGIQYFFCGIYAFFQFLMISCETNMKKNKIKGNKKNYAKKTIIFAFLLIVSIFMSAIVLGFLPGKLGFLIVDYQGNAFLRNFVVMTLKLLVFYFLLVLLWIFPIVNEFYRFNKAGEDVLKKQIFEKKSKKNEKMMPNFLNYLIFVFVLDFVVVTLWGSSYGFWFNLILDFAVFLACMGLGFEIQYLICNSKCKFVSALIWLTAFLVYKKPTITHVETTMVAITEIDLLTMQKGREFMEDENKKAFSVVYTEVKNKLANAGINDKSDADWLIATVLGKNRTEVKLVSSITEKQYQDIMKATDRRAKGESIDNIFGFCEFYGLRFDVNKKVLTPRMETEILVENVLKAEKNFKNATILDLGTGSGAIAISLACHCDAKITAVDISKSALVVAETNAKKNGAKIEFIHSNLFEDLKRKRKFDIIVSNPPYIPSKDIKKLDKNVQECDPILALDGGEDGLDFYRTIITQAPKKLNSNGMLFFEVGKGQASAVKKLMKENSFIEIKIIKDYNKIERVICGKYR